MAGREKTTSHVMIIALQKTIDLYPDKLSIEELLDAYTKISELADLMVKANPDNEQVKQMRQDLETLIVTSGALTCEKLIAMFEPGFKAEPQNKELLIRIVQLMSKNNCTDKDFYYQVVEAYHDIEPSPLSAYSLGRVYMAKGDANKAVQFYKQAITHPDVTQEDKIKYCLDIATIYLQKLNNIGQAITYVRQVLSIAPNNGEAYMLMGNIWAGQKCGDNDIAKKAVFWVAVDYFNKAKSADPSLAEDANKFINSYSQYFPMQQDAFFYDLQDGDTYTVSCNGLTEQTRVRTRK
jgi:tetratricopeptide (TPR) repeat protein